MAEVLRMPEVLANATEAVLQAWTVEVGVPFAVGDVIATVETEKAVVDIESDRAGVLLVTLGGEGVDVEVGAPIAVVGQPGEDPGDIDTLLRNLGLGDSSIKPTDAPLEAPLVVAEQVMPHRVFSSPLARRLAKEHGLDITEIDGSGPNGRIMRRDVDAAVTQREEAPTATPAMRAPAAPVARRVPEHEASAGPHVDEPHSRLRRAVARRLTESKQEVPHFYLRATCRVGALLNLRTDINAHSATKASLNDFVVKGAAYALRTVPDMNVIWMPDAVRRFTDVDVAVAVASERGLVTPVLRAVDRATLGDVARDMRALRARADAGTLRQDELEGGALAVTNLGMFGTEEFAAIVNPPQAAILAVGAVREQPVAIDGAATVASVMTVTLSVDHRPVDGVVAARWLAAFVAAVEDPIRLLV